MESKEKVILCGLGAVGTVYAEQFLSNGVFDFKVLVDNARLERYSKNPILYNRIPLNFSYITPESSSYEADLILITTKMTGLGEALEEIKPFVGENTVIIPLLNGVTSEKLVAEVFGWEKVLYGYFIGHSAVREGNNIIHDGVNTLVFGSEIHNDTRVERVKNILEKAGINYKIPDDIRHSLWCKYMLNVASNPTTALLRMTFGEMINNQKFMEFAVNIMKEVQAVARAEGVNGTETMIQETVEHLLTMCPEGKTSMLQDVEAGRLTEIDMFAGTMVELGQKHAIPTPYCSFLKEMFEIMHEKFLFSHTA